MKKCRLFIWIAKRKKKILMGCIHFATFSIALVLTYSMLRSHYLHSACMVEITVLQFLPDHLFPCRTLWKPHSSDATKSAIEHWEFCISRHSLVPGWHLKLSARCPYSSTAAASVSEYSVSIHPCIQPSFIPDVWRCNTQPPASLYSVTSELSICCLLNSPSMSCDPIASPHHVAELRPAIECIFVSSTLTCKAPMIFFNCVALIPLR